MDVFYKGNKIGIEQTIAGAARITTHDGEAVVAGFLVNSDTSLNYTDLFKIKDIVCKAIDDLNKQLSIHDIEKLFTIVQVIS